MGVIAYAPKPDGVMKLGVGILCAFICITGSKAGGMFGNLTCQTDPVKEGRGGAGASISLWPNGVIPIIRDNSFTDADYHVFWDAMQLIEKNTCLKFVSYQGGSGPYLKLKRVCACRSTAQGCFSGGYTDGLGAATPRSLVMSAACVTTGSKTDLMFMVHEVFHALGIVHTQTRPDRDYYVNVWEGNIQAQYRSQYAKCSGCKTYGTSYNCMSIMHYRDYFFPAYSGAKTMTAKVANCNLKTYASQVTTSDWNLVKAMYCTSNTNSCDGDKNDWTCCTPQKKCAAGQGDCDSDSDCQNGLVCGLDNCRQTNSAAHENADCCRKPTTTDKCNGDGNAWTCCTSSRKCNVGQGDCDRDSDCQSGLVCGKDNCRDFHRNAKRWADCCKYP